MFPILKRCLGIDVLEKDINFYRTQWTQMIERFLVINDHLVELKENLKAHDVLSRKQAQNEHLEIMTRLGMLLTAVDKLKAPEDVVSPMAQMMRPKERLEDVQNKILQFLQNGRGRYFKDSLLSLKLGVEPSLILSALKTLLAQNRIQAKGDDCFRVIPLSQQIQQEILAFLAKHPRESFHYKALAHHLSWSIGQVSATLSLLCGRGIIKRVRTGFYALPTKKENVHDAS